MVPVVDKDQKPLMPCSEKRARKMIESKKATYFWHLGVFCIRLNTEPSARNTQIISLGIDPGSKREGFTVKAEAPETASVVESRIRGTGALRQPHEGAAS